MEFDSDKRAKESSLRERRYAIRYPFAAFAEMLELESGTRVSGVTSDLSPVFFSGRETQRQKPQQEFGKKV